MYKYCSKIKNMLLNIMFASSILYIILFVYDISIKSMPHLDIENYIESIDYGILSDKQVETFNNILNAIANEDPVFSCPTYSNKEWHEILTQLGLYFGTTEKLESLIYWNDNYAKLNLDMFKSISNQKIIIDARVDEALSTLIEGSDRYKLWQISNYVSKKITYTNGCRDTITALNGKGVCNSYSMLFYKMATRLGIKTYICYGYAGNDYHAWNMVKLNGEHLYYDITWYDNIMFDIRYISSRHSWNRNYQINNKWYIKQN